jgi:ATP-dependent Lhr-like helicase
VTAHHGSLSRETRLSAEERLKSGRLRALVATASLELGIDIGHVDLVVQLASPRRIATFLQRVGRSGHTVGGRPKGRLFPLTRDDLVECTALVDAVRRGELDALILHEQPLDVLAQQIAAEAAAEDWSEPDLLALARRAYPYRNLDAATFEQVLEMLARGYSTRRGRRAALVHRDVINRRVRGRRGTRHVAITSGGAIPEIADYRVELEPEGTFVGTLNEDFAIESSAGDVFQLGNASWRILRVLPGVVRVADAHGQPPNLPFWLGEAPARSDELSLAVSRLRSRVESILEAEPDADTAVAAVADAVRIAPLAAEQLVSYLAETRRMLGALPTQDTLILERFFDEAGGMQLVLHAPFGGRVNRAWGLALRKKFCRTFNFELQAAATDDGLLLSLGPQHSFPLVDVFRYLHPGTVKDTLIQAVLDAPLFQTRWRWNTTLSLAVQRSRHGRKVAPQIQRMQAEDLLAAVFPDAAACLENIAGDREVPEHPLVTQSLRDCLEEAMDLPALVRVLHRVSGGALRMIAQDTPEPSPLSHELLNARPWAFLDDAPLEERRTQAIYTRRALEPSSAADLGALDADAIARVRLEAWPEAEDPDEMHDALLTFGFLPESEIALPWHNLLRTLAAQGRAKHFVSSHGLLWVATERAREWVAVHPPAADALRPDRWLAGENVPAREDAIRELVRSRLEVIGPVTAGALALSMCIAASEVEAALIAIEGQGIVLRGVFTPGSVEREWCDRRLLARIHRYTLNRLRAEIQPVSAADFMQFLFRWQHVEADRRVDGLDGLAAVVRQLEGFEVPTVAWESDVLPQRCAHYSPELLDGLCLTGRVLWGRLSAPASGVSFSGGPLRSSPIALLMRPSARAWLRPRSVSDAAPAAAATLAVQQVLSERGACFFHELVGLAGLLPARIEEALGELVALGLVTADSFAGLRALLTPNHGAAARNGVVYSVETAGRWSWLPVPNAAVEPAPRDANGNAMLEHRARTLLERYGVVFRRVLGREPNAPAWRELVRVYRRLEARGEIRGGRFVSGFAGEQFAIPDAVGMLRSMRREPERNGTFAVSAADPLNLTGIVTPGDRVPALAGNRVLYRDGVPVAAREGGALRWLAAVAENEKPALAALLRPRPALPALRAYLRSSKKPAKRREPQTTH